MKLRKLSKKSIAYSGIVLITILCSILLFYFAYQNDNKYTSNGPQPKYGVLKLDESDLNENPYIYLTKDWEIYRNQLLTPEDFSSGRQILDEYIFIGQYGGFEGSQSNSTIQRSPHGSATYRLNVVIPDNESYYTLELPEIYSSYNLYINDILMEQMGSTNKDSYKAEIGNSKITFLAKSKIEIIIAVSDYDHLYSGVVYPPAFGYPETINTMLNERLVIRVIATTISLGVGFFYFGVWFLLRKEKDISNNVPMYFSVLCLCFAAMISYPVIKTFATSGILWYIFENLCFPLFLMIVAIINKHLTKDQSFASKTLITFGLSTCFFGLFLHIFAKDSLELMFTYSILLEWYTYATAIYLIVTSFYAAYRQMIYSKALLIGSTIFGVSLLMDRLYPLFEPIRFGWFSEISGGALVLAIGIVLAREVATQFRLRMQLETNMENANKIIDTQKSYYPLVLEKEKELSAAQHDFRHHIVIIYELALANENSKLIDYINEIDSRSRFDTRLSYSKHFVIDMLLKMYSEIAKVQNTHMEIDVTIAMNLSIDDSDLCVIIGNLLENALEATAKLEEQKRIIKIKIKYKMKRLGIRIENTFDGVINKQNEHFLSRKKADRLGIGIASVEAVCSAYDGSIKFHTDNQKFICEIILPLREEEYSENSNL